MSSSYENEQSLAGIQVTTNEHLAYLKTIHNELQDIFKLVNSYVIDK